MSMQRVMILLSGCGPLDGSDPFESVFCHYWLEKKGCEVIYAAPSGTQLHSVNHIDGKNSRTQKRVILQEAARLVRGKLFPLKELSPKLMDGIVIPGGQGTPKNYFSLNKNKIPEVKSEIRLFLKRHVESRGTVLAISLSEFVVRRSLPDLKEAPDLLSLKPGQFVSNEEFGVVLAPGSLLTSNITTLFIETERVINEFMNIMMKRKSS